MMQFWNNRSQKKEDPKHRTKAKTLVVPVAFRRTAAHVASAFPSCFSAARLVALKDRWLEPIQWRIHALRNAHPETSRSSEKHLLQTIWVRSFLSGSPMSIIQTQLPLLTEAAERIKYRYCAHGPTTLFFHQTPYGLEALKKPSILADGQTMCRQLPTGQTHFFRLPPEAANLTRPLVCHTLGVLAPDQTPQGTTAGQPPAGRSWQVTFVYIYI